MAGEIAFAYNRTFRTVSALILDTNKSLRWNGSAFVAHNTVASNALDTGFISLTEQQSSDSVNLGFYVGDFPTGIINPGNYSILFFDVTSGDPTDFTGAVGQQAPLAWTGSQEVGLDKLWMVTREGVAQSATSNTITLDASAEGSIDDFYKYSIIVIVSGTGAGQTPLPIIGYDSATKTATMYQNWAVTPDSTSVFRILGFAKV